jgi:hypothetical protein
MNTMTNTNTPLEIAHFEVGPGQGRIGIAPCPGRLFRKSYGRPWYRRNLHADGRSGMMAAMVTINPLDGYRKNPIIDAAINAARSGGGDA